MNVTERESAGRDDPMRSEQTLSTTSAALVSIEGERDPLLGRMVGSFRVLRQLGAGAMGTVYLAEHPLIGNKVAIKLLHESLANDPELVGRFFQEARAVNLVGHENLVSVFDLSLLPPNRYYMVMEHLEGETLTELLANGPLSPLVALPILSQLCDALQAVHDVGVVHRDLKPDNIFLVRRRGCQRFVKVVDFGIAKMRQELEDSSLTVACCSARPTTWPPSSARRGRWTGAPMSTRSA